MSAKEDWVSGRTCVYNIGYHIVWSTKYRRQIIVGAIADRLKLLFIEIGKEFDFDVKEIEIMPDHCHVFVSCHPKITPSNIVKCLKGISARKIFLEFPIIKKKLWGGHLWNPSYYIGTVGNMNKEVVLKYIQNQKSENI
ncbi:MAG: IS200/IS605 family transposase [Oligoflexales bacterium]|nr:IS200/IS605 family transposase [Oligoflexales bacterium]